MPQLQKSTTLYTTYFTRRPSPANILNLPQRILRWIYSISMIICILLMLGFIAVTPLDVVIQTLGSSNATVVKTFIVIGVCVLFVIISMIIYFTRVYKYRISLNDIPNKSLYIPFENDYPKAVFHHIDDNLKRCSEIKFKAGPLQNHNRIINHAGLSPPEYIQKRNLQCFEKNSMNGFGNGNEVMGVMKKGGCLLPPNVSYEDIVRSLGDKFYDGSILTDDRLSIELSMRDIILYLSRQCREFELETNTNVVKPNIARLIKFGNLIKEEDIFEFIIEFDKFGQICQNDYQLKLPTKSVNNRSDTDNNNNNRYSHVFDSGLDYYSSAGLFDDDFDDVSTDYYLDEQQTNPQIFINEEQLDEDENLFKHQKVENKYFQNATTEDDYYDDELSESLSVRKLKHRDSVSSSKSVIRNKIALNRNSQPSIIPAQFQVSPSRPSQDSYDQQQEEDDDDDDGGSLRRNISGYVSDSENDDSDESEEQFYQFRRRRPINTNTNNTPANRISPTESVRSVEFKPYHSQMNQ
ncbi:DLT1 Defect at low temperature protein 1 [Candida maltosa Xu316]